MSEGHFRCYVEKRFGADARAMIDTANEIIGEYEAQGFVLTVRQLYYQFVSRGIFENVIANYNRLSVVISDARLAGLVSWTAIEDRTRNLRGLNTYQSPAEIIRSARHQYRRDLWEDQPIRAEVWVEKEALLGVIEPVCNELRVDYFGVRGYNSQSEQWRAGRRFANYVGKGQRPIVFHLGDHDPSGIDMTRDNQERLSLFAGTPIQVIRLALNMPQVEQYNPPPNPTKMTDSRAVEYVRNFGRECWELDALSPTVIAGLIRKAVLAFRNEELWNAALAREAAECDELDVIIEGLS